MISYAANPSIVRTSAFVIALALGAAVRLAAFPLRGTEDVGSWKIWAYAASEDPTAVYGVGGSPAERGVVRWGARQTTVDYPPVALYMLAAVGHAYRAWDPAFTDGPALLAFLKLPGLLCAALLSALLFVVVRRETGETSAARWAALAFWINPALVLNGEVLGYLDPWMMLPAMLALLSAWRGSAVAAGALTAIAAATKPQGLLVAPVIAVALRASGGWTGVLRASLGALATTAGILLPFAMRGALGNMWLAFGAFYGRRDALSALAANLWWIVNWALRVKFYAAEVGLAAALRLTPRILSITRFREIGFPNPRPFATGLVLALVGWACWKARETRELAVLALVGSFSVHAFFMLSVGVHEHHMILAVPLLALSAALRPHCRPLFYVVSAIVALNMNLFYGVSLGAGWAVPRGILGIDLSVVLAVVNLATFFWHGRVLALAARGAGRAFATSFQGTRYSTLSAQH
jgi:hypothetical protein